MGFLGAELNFVKTGLPWGPLCQGAPREGTPQVALTVPGVRWFREQVLCFLSLLSVISLTHIYAKKVRNSDDLIRNHFCSLTLTAH